LSRFIMMSKNSAFGFLLMFDSFLMQFSILLVVLPTLI
jgi:hypothetical protein